MSSFFIPHFHSMMPKSQMHPPSGLPRMPSSSILTWFSEVAPFPASRAWPAWIWGISSSASSSLPSLLLLGANLLWLASLRPDVCASVSQSKGWSCQLCFSYTQPQQLGTLLTVSCWRPGAQPSRHWWPSGLFLTIIQRSSFVKSLLTYMVRDSLLHHLPRRAFGCVFLLGGAAEQIDPVQFPNVAIF